MVQMIECDCSILGYYHATRGNVDVQLDVKGA
jgi:hypothetical protein